MNTPVYWIREQWVREPDRVLAIMVGCLFAIPVWCTTLLPMGDLGHHVGLVAVLKDFGSNPLYAETFYRTGWYNTNSSVYYLMTGLSYLVRPETSARLLVSVYTVGFPLAFWYLLRSLGSATWPAWVSAILIPNHAYTHGYFNFFISIPLYFVGVGLAARFFRRPNWRSALGWNLLAWVVFWSHAMVFVQLLASAGLLALVMGDKGVKPFAVRALSLTPSLAPLFPWLVELRQITTSTSNQPLFSSWKYYEPREVAGLLITDLHRVLSARWEGYLVAALLLILLALVALAARRGRHTRRPVLPPLLLLVSTVLVLFACPHHFPIVHDVAPRFTPFVWAAALTLIARDLPASGLARDLKGLFFGLLLFDVLMLSRAYARFSQEVEPLYAMAETVQPRTRVYKALFIRNDNHLFHNGGVYWHLDNYIMAWRGTLHDDILSILPTCIFQFQPGKQPPRLDRDRLHRDPRLGHYDYVLTYGAHEQKLEHLRRSSRLELLFKEGKWALFGVQKLGLLNGNTLDPNR